MPPFSLLLVSAFCSAVVLKWGARRERFARGAGALNGARQVVLSFSFHNLTFCGSQFKQKSRNENRFWKKWKNLVKASTTVRSYPRKSRSSFVKWRSSTSTVQPYSSKLWTKREKLFLVLCKPDPDSRSAQVVLSSSRLWHRQHLNISSLCLMVGVKMLARDVQHTFVSRFRQKWGCEKCPVEKQEMWTFCSHREAIFPLKKSYTEQTFKWACNRTTIQTHNQWSVSSCKRTM